MATGRVHEKAGQVTLVAGAGLTLLAVADQPALVLPGFAFMAGLVNGFLVTPDIDLPTITREEQRILGVPAIGPVLGRAWVVFWLAYAKTFVHRGTSHFPIVGTFTRAAYQWAILGGVLFTWMTLDPSFRVPFPAVALIAVYLNGWMVQDHVHLMYDAESPWSIMWMALLILLQLWVMWAVLV